MATQDSKRKLKTIGWREWICIPGLGVEKIKAKIDTGARTSTLHALNIETFERDGVKMVRFKMHPIQRSTYEVVTAEAPVLDVREVRSSSGQVQLRVVIQVEMILGGDRRLIELTLTNRDLMGFRMLLGREAMRDRYIVDPGRSYLAGDRR